VWYFCHIYHGTSIRNCHLPKFSLDVLYVSFKTSKPEILRFQTIPPFIFPLQSLEEEDSWTDIGLRQNLFGMRQNSAETWAKKLWSWAEKLWTWAEKLWTGMEKLWTRAVKQLTRAEKLLTGVEKLLTGEEKQLTVWEKTRVLKRRETRRLQRRVQFKLPFRGVRVWKKYWYHF